MPTLLPFELLMEPLIGRTPKPDLPVESYEAMMQRRAAEAAAKTPLHLRLLPRSLRVGLARRKESRAMSAAFSRLASLSPHLLDDIGVEVKDKPARVRFLPEPRPVPEPRAAQAQPVTHEPLPIAAE